MKSSAWPGGRWRGATGRTVACWVLAPLLALQGCTSDEEQKAPVARLAARRPGLSKRTSALTPAEVARTAEGAEYVAGQLLVRFRKGAALKRQASVHALQGAEVLHAYRTQPELQVVAVPEGSLEEALAAYRRNPEVEHAEPNYLYRASVYRASEVRANGMPDDPRFSELWGLHNGGQGGGTADADLNAPEAWELTTGSTSAGVVAVIDTGIDYNHPDLAPNMWVNPGEVAGNGVDDDGNGYVDDVHGINAIDNSGNPFDDNGHGTHVAGTIAANGDDGRGVAGVNWRARLMGCKFLSGSGSGSLADAVKCLEYVRLMRTRALHPVPVIATNNSWGGGGFSNTLHDGIASHRNEGILFIAAAGNSGSNNDTTAAYPSGYFLSNIVAVAASDRTDSKADFSSYGRRTVHITAPGVDILSTQPGGGYQSLDGTSMATPHVAGVVALLHAQDPSRDWRQLKNLLLSGGVPQASTHGKTLSGRRLRAADTGGRGSLTCQDQVFSTRVRPIAGSASLPLGDSLQVVAYNLNCGSPAGAPNVTVSPGGGSLAMRDDGRYGDEVAGDGLYTGYFEPSGPGTYTLTFPDGETLSVESVTSYVSGRVPLAWRTIAGTSLALDDDSVGTVSSPFPIPFAAGAGRTTLYVGMNGAVSFTNERLAPSNIALPATGFTTLVAPFWDDLYPNGAEGNVFWQVVGTAPQRELVVEWRNVHHYATRSGSPADTLTFQAVFFEGRSDVLFNYRDVNVGNATVDKGAGATAGVQVAGTVATSHSFNSPGLENDTALLWTWPASSQPPVVSALSAQPSRLREGEPLNIQLEFNDPDGASDGPWRVQFDMDYPGWFTLDVEQTVTAQGAVSASVQAQASGQVTVAARVQDGRGARSAARTFSLTVEDVAPALAALSVEGALNERQPVTFRTSFTDPGADAPWKVEWDFAYDGASFNPERAVSVSAAGDVSLEHAFPEDGTFTVAARVTDKDGVSSNLQVLQVQVADLRPSLTELSGNVHLREGETLRLGSTFTQPGDDSKPWLVQWDFHYDGTTFDVDHEEERNTDGALSLSRFLADSGTATYALRVVDADGSVSEVRTLQVVCEEVNPSVSAFTAEALSDASEPATVRLAVQARSGSATAAVDPVEAFLWDFDGDGTFDYTSNAPFAIHRYLDNPQGGDTYTARVRVVDEDSYTEAEVAVRVLNAPPTLQPLADQSAEEGHLLAVRAVASDPGQDTLAFSLQGAPWGMSITSDGLLLWTPSYSQSSLGGTPWSITVVVVDDDGASASRTVNITARWADRDFDGMADTWERSHGMDPTRDDSAQDNDGNGVSNRDEFLADTGNLVLPHQPEVESPLAGARVRTEQLVLTTRNVAATGEGSAVRYQFQLFADAELARKVRDVTVDADAAGTTTSVTLTSGTESSELEDLEDDQAYRWRVRTVEGSAEGSLHGPWSAVRHLTYDPVNDLPGAPRTAWPVTGSEVSMREPVLTVDNAEDVDDEALTYVFELSGDADFTTGVQRSEPVAADARGSTSWKVLQPLAASGTYWWRAVARDERGGVTPGEVASFTVGGGGGGGNHEPAPPVLAAPQREARVETSTPVLMAHAAVDADGDTLSYAFEVDTTPTFSSPARQVSPAQQVGPNGVVSWRCAPLVENSRYYWRVRAMDGLSAGDWALGTFTVDVRNDAPSSPVPLNPTEAIVITHRPILTVQNARDPEGHALTYGFEVRKSNGARVIRRENLPEGPDGTTSFVLPVDLMNGTEYVWVAWAKDSREATGAVSREATFRVQQTRRPSQGGGHGCGAAPGVAGGVLPVLALVGLTLLGRRRRRA